MLIILMLVSLIVPQIVASCAAQNTSFIYPSDDSWVEAEYPNTNHGSETVLRVKADSRTRRAYLKFDLSSIPNGKIVTSVKLYLYCSAVDSNPTVVINVHETLDSWAEGTITWNNAPPVGSYLSQTTLGGSGQYYAWDISSYGVAQYNGDKVLSALVKLPQDDPSQNNPNYARDFASKEYIETNHDPYLEVIYIDSPPVASFTYSPSYPVANDTVSFDASASYDPDGNIVSYSWNFGDGNLTTVITPTISHVYSAYGNYTVILTVTDGTGLADSHSEVVEVVDPAMLRVSLPEGTYVTQNTGDPWIDQGWLLYKTGNSWSFMVKIYDTSNSVESWDTHLIVALNPQAYNNLLSLTINGTSIPKTAFVNGRPKPYGTKYWPDCVYPAWFNDTYVNVGYIAPKGYKTLQVSVSFSDGTNARMHFDAYGHLCTPISWSHVTWSPNSEDSTVLYQAAPSPLSVSITPPSATIDLSQSVSFSSTVSGGTPPYTYQWYVNNVAYPGANSPTWLYTPTATGYYLVHLNVTDNTGTKAKSNISPVTVNSAPSVSISPTLSAIKLGESVPFSSTVIGGTTPHSYQWYLNDTAVPGATSDSWTFTPVLTGYYVIFLKVTDNALYTAISNDAYVTVGLPTYKLTVQTSGLGTYITHVYNGTNLLGTATDATPYVGSFVQGSVIWVDVDSPIVDGSKRFVFTSWSGDVTGSTRPVSITMDGNRTITANYKTQYAVTFTQTGSAVAPTVTYTADIDPTETVPFTVWVKAGTEITYTYQDIVSGASGVRYVLTSVAPSSPQTVTGPLTISGTYQTRYYLTVNTNPAEVLTLNPAAVSGQGWYNSGFTATVDAVQNVDKVAGDSRYDFKSWTGAAPTGVGNQATVLMDGPKTATANYQLQYKITFVQSGVGSDFAGTVVIIDSTNYGRDSVSFWWDSGSSHSFAFQSPLVVTVNGKQYVWTSTTGLSTLKSGSITVSSSGSVTGNYKTQYYLLVSSPSGYGSPSPTSGWFDASSSITASVTSPWSGPTGTRYVCTGWTGIGSVPPSGTGSSVTFTITQSSSISWNWVTQYYLTVRTDPSGIATIPGEGWYNASKSVSLSAPSVSGYTFLNWDVDGASQGSGVSSITVNMNAPHTATAHYAVIPPSLSVSISPLSASILVGQSTTFTSTVSGGTSPYKYQWYLTGNSVLGATSSTWTFTPTTSGIYYVYLQIKDANNNTAQSETARVVVSGVSFGGYSVSLTKPVAKTPLICYSMLLAIFSAVLILFKRKRK
jgi:hypothetical protein